MSAVRSHPFFPFMPCALADAIQNSLRCPLRWLSCSLPPLCSCHFILYATYLDHICLSFPTLLSLPLLLDYLCSSYLYLLLVADFGSIRMYIDPYYCPRFIFLYPNSFLFMCCQYIYVPEWCFSCQASYVFLIVLF